jgi:hypothetical protein
MTLSSLFFFHYTFGDNLKQLGLAEKNKPALLPILRLDTISAENGLLFTNRPIPG